MARMSRIARQNARRMCVCGHRQDEHKGVYHAGEGVGPFVSKPCTHVTLDVIDRDTQVETPCRCLEFDVAQATPTQRRSAKKSGSKFELDVKNLAQEHGLPARKISGSGNPDVIIGAEGDELLSIECHFAKDAKTYGHQLDKLKQAERLAKGRAGAPLPVYAYRLKLGPGEPTTAYALMELDVLFALIERAG